MNILFLNNVQNAQYFYFLCLMSVIANASEMLDLIILQTLWNCHF